MFACLDVIRVARSAVCVFILLFFVLRAGNLNEVDLEAEDGLCKGVGWYGSYGYHKNCNE